MITLKKAMWILGTAGVILLLCGIIIPNDIPKENIGNPIELDSQLDKKQNDSEIPDKNYEFWSQSSDALGFNIYRSYVFYNFTNPEEFFFKN